MRHLLRVQGFVVAALLSVLPASAVAVAAQERAVEAQPGGPAAEAAPPAQDPVAGGAEGILSRIWNTTLPPGNEVTVKSVVIALLLVTAGFVFARRIARVVRGAVLPRVHVSRGASAAVESILFYLLLLIVFYSALSVAGVPLTAFALVGGAAAIGIGFGSQTLVANFIAGLILLLEQPIREGDLIQIDDLYGNVVRVGARSTRVRTGDNVEILVPNSLFLEEKIYNLTLTDSRIRTKVSVGVAYGSPTEEVAKLMKQAASEHERIHDTPEPIVLFKDFGNDSLAFEVHFWIDMRTVMSRRLIESDLRFRIDALFREAGITIAFPQRDVHLDAAKPLEVRILGGQP